MGCPLSGILSKYTSKILKNTSQTYKIKEWIRYVDDTRCIVMLVLLGSILNTSHVYDEKHRKRHIQNLKEQNHLVNNHLFVLTSTRACSLLDHFVLYWIVCVLWVWVTRRRTKRYTTWNTSHKLFTLYYIIFFCEKRICLAITYSDFFALAHEKVYVHFSSHQVAVECYF